MDFSKVEECHDENSQELKFYYSREERIKRAPKIVQDFYGGNFKNCKVGVFRSLVDSKSNRLIFFALILCFFVVIFNFLFNKSSEDIIYNIPVSLSAFSFDDTIYVSVCFDSTNQEKSNDILPINVMIKCFDSQKQLINKELLTGSYQGIETYLRTTFTDYDIVNVVAEIKISKYEKKLSSVVKKN